MKRSLKTHRQPLVSESSIVPDTSDSVSLRWTRRVWLARNVVTALMVTPAARLAELVSSHHVVRSSLASGASAVHGSYVQRGSDDTPDPSPAQAVLAQRAVDAAMRVGAQYADARLTSIVQHRYMFGPGTGLVQDAEEVGVGIRALVNGCWGFAACPSGDTADVERIARAAVAQAMVNVHRGLSRTVTLGRIPPAVGQWTTPLAVDPFTVSIEEKLAFMRYWQACAKNVGLQIDVTQSTLFCARQERVVATSEGGNFTQVVYETGGRIVLNKGGFEAGPSIQGIEMTGRGWELFLDAKIPEQIRAMPARYEALVALQRSTRPVTVGRYTLVCDGATMAALLNATLGLATQLDRAMGYEANAGGSSFLDDPLAMLGEFKVAAPTVTITANRSAPAQLATVKWDDEGVTPMETILIKDGVLHDFQTTREQAAWLTPYYEKTGRPISSNGYAAAENALNITMQHTPNLSLEPGSSMLRLEDLVADVRNGVLIEQGRVVNIDSQARTGLLHSRSLRRIQNGKAGALVRNGAIQFNTLDLWRNVTTIGGPLTRMVVPFTMYKLGFPDFGEMLEARSLSVKGEPPQSTSHSVQAVAATIINQPLIDLSRTA